MRYISSNCLLPSIDSMLRALIPMAAIVAPMKVKFQEEIGMGVFGSSKGPISDRWTFAIFPTER